MTGPPTTLCLLPSGHLVRDLLSQLLPQMSLPLPKGSDVSANCPRGLRLPPCPTATAWACSSVAVPTDRRSQALTRSRKRRPDLAPHLTPRLGAISVRTGAHLAPLFLQTWTLFFIKCQIQWSILIRKGRLSLPLETSY